MKPETPNWLPVYDLLREPGSTDRSMSERFGLSAVVFAGMRKGRRPTFTTVEKIAHTLGRSVIELTQIAYGDSEAGRE